MAAGPLPPRWRRCLIITTATEMAASTAIAIRIGTKGEEPPSLWEAGLPEAVCSGEGVAFFAPELALPPGLPWPEPPS